MHRCVRFQDKSVPAPEVGKSAPDRLLAGLVKTVLSLSKPQDDGGTERDNAFSIWNVIRHDVAP
jgi:hypothetical protein